MLFTIRQVISQLLKKTEFPNIYLRAEVWSPLGPIYPIAVEERQLWIDDIGWFGHHGSGLPVGYTEWYPHVPFNAVANIPYLLSLNAEIDCDGGNEASTVGQFYGTVQWIGANGPQ